MFHWGQRLGSKMPYVAIVCFWVTLHEIDWPGATAPYVKNATHVLYIRQEQPCLL